MAKRIIREKLADVQHQIWAHWMRYMFSICMTDDSGNTIIPADKVLRWERQMMTSYADLSEEEKNSDREQADKIIAMLSELI